MSNALDRYREAREQAPVPERLFNAHFLGILSVKFDNNIDKTAWDDALTKATEHAKQTAKEMSA